MIIKIGPESPNQEGCRRSKFNVYKDTARIQMLGRIGKEFQCLHWEDKVRTAVFIRIVPEFQCFEGWGQNSNVYNNRARNPIFGRIRA